MNTAPQAHTPPIAETLETAEVHDLSDILDGLNMSQHIAAFKENEIDVDLMSVVEPSDLEDIGLSSSEVELLMGRLRVLGVV